MAQRTRTDYTLNFPFGVIFAFLHFCIFAFLHFCISFHLQGIIYICLLGISVGVLGISRVIWIRHRNRQDLAFTAEWLLQGLPD